MNREQLNQTHFQQALRSADYFAPADKQAWLDEIHARQAFEQAALAAQKTAENPPLARQNGRKIALISAIILAAAIGYWQTGRYQQVQQGQQALSEFQQQRDSETERQHNDHYIISLQNQLRQNRENGDLWFELGQAYSLNNEFEAALHCFRNALGILGERASILGAMATVDYYQHKQKLSAQAKSWLNQALKLDPKESASLLLLASDAFLHNNPPQAIFYWEQALDSENQALNRREIIKSIKVAEQMVR